MLAAVCVFILEAVQTKKVFIKEHWHIHIIHTLMNKSTC